VWPIRVILTANETANPNDGGDRFVSQKGQYVFILAPGQKLPLGEIAGILLDENTPRLPPEVESGLRQLFDTLQAHGSHVTWGGPPAHPDLDWARMQLLATKFEYESSFHIFLTALRGGSTLRVAERNAFGKDSTALEAEAKSNLAAGNWQPVSVSGRPLDPKRDFGEHSIDGEAVTAYLVGNSHSRSPEDEIRAGTKNPIMYVQAAQGRPPEQALPLLKKAAQLNPLWAEPIFLEAQLTSDLKEREALLKKALQLNPRSTKAWIALADTQMNDGHALEAQGTWLCAEDSAAPGPEREAIHRQRLKSEQERLDAAEAARQKEREAARLDDERAQRAEEARIHAAEAKANQQLDETSGGVKPEKVVPWDETVRQRKMQGTLVRVDCLGGHERLWLKDKSGQSIQLFLKNPAELDARCGPQQQPRRVSVAYSPRDDDRLNTSGDVVSINFQ